MRHNEISDNKAVFENESLSIFDDSKVTRITSIYLTEITENKNYWEMHNRLRQASENDIFIIYINSPGGYVDTGLNIINSMKNCRGTVYTCISGPIYSMAPLIALSGQKVFVEEDVFMMFHDFSAWSHGKGNEIYSQITFEKPHFDELFKKITHKFLTKKEIKVVLAGGDLYLGRDELIKRLKKLELLGNSE